ncbi:hypothetical protein PspLS_05894 [Pyricularia sp. CBS 133598]|nr:hypothetical protein PspLS_05894 [Pyricularia sp. CBS 133598]
MPHIMDTLMQTGVYELLGGREVQNELVIKWGDAKPLTPGQPMPEGLGLETQRQPSVLTNLNTGGPEQLLMMIGDYRGTPGLPAQMCHWVVGDVPVFNRQVVWHQGAPLVDYKPPMMSGNLRSRLIFLLLSPKPGKSTNIEFIEEIKTIVDQGKFEVRGVLDRKELDIVAATVLLG